MNTKILFFMGLLIINFHQLYPKIPITLSPTEYQEIVHSEEPYVFIGHEITTAFTSIMMLFEPEELPHYLMTIKEHIDNKRQTIPLNVMQQALRHIQDALDTCNNDNLENLKNIFTNYAQQIAQGSVIVKIDRAPRETETPLSQAEQLNQTPRDVYIEGQLTVGESALIGGNLTVIGTITASNLGVSSVTSLGSSQDKAITRFSGTSGSVIQNSALIATDFTSSTQNNVAIQADDGSTANITLALVPKGAGALTTAIPDATATGGNARGTNAVDLQTSRAAATQVASGASSVIGGGASNTASGSFATTPGGNLNTAAGDYSFAAGRRAKANEQGTFVWADSTDADFNSAGINTFNVRATNGSFFTGDLVVTGSITASHIITGSGVTSSSTSTPDNAIARFDGTSGQIIQNSALIATDFTSSTQNNVAIQADDGSTANITLALVPKGTGALTAAIPDATATGGNARGTNAVDLQTLRVAATQVASGNYAVIAGGSTNEASGERSSVLGGSSNIASAITSTIAGGNGNTTTGSSSCITGGFLNNAAGDASSILGGSSNSTPGLLATVVGGNSNTATGDYSFAAGRRAKANEQGTFVWADSTDADFNSAGIDTFNVRATNGSFFTGDLTLTGSITATNIITDTAVVKSSSSTSQDNAIARFDGTTGKLIQNSALIATDFTAVTQNNVAIQADDGTTTDITFALVPKGTGALTTAIPDATATGGNARGTNAVDLQTSRAAATQVASGTSSAVGGGASNTASGSFATTPGGNLNTAAGDYSFAAGRRAKANEQGTFVWADSTDADFNSAGIDTFNVRATNGSFFTGDLTLTGSITATNIITDTAVVKNSSTSQNNAIARFDGTSGKLIQNSALIATDFTAVTQNNVAIRADDGATANIALALVPKGTGALTTAIPDATATGGNARGTNAVDLQTSRAAATQVASGTSSAVGGGASNTASGSFATTPGGNLNTAAGDYSFAAGRRAKANEQGTFVWADSTDADFNSAGIDTFNVRATNGSFFTGDLTLTGSITATNIITDTGLVKSSSSTSQDNAIARFDGTSGKLIQNSALIATDFSSSTQNNVAIQADDGSTTNITLALVPKGTGALATAIPDATATGGNARGTNAVDLQTSRAAATQVASGTSSAVGGGASNTASGSFATTPGGNLNTAAGDYSFAAGRRAKANEQGTFVWADSTDADFNSAGIDTFNVRATNGSFFTGDMTLTGTITASNLGVSGVTTTGASQDKAVTRFSGTSGTVIQNSALIATDFTTSTQANVAVRADDGSTANITFALVPKGTGALTTAIPDGTTTGGNARGSRAVDLQLIRTNSAQVASGSLATICGGAGNTASGDQSTVVGGDTHQATGQNSIISGGSTNSASGDFSSVVGGQSNVAAGIYAFAAGRRAKANEAGTFVWADSTNADFNSAGINTFNVRATNGSFFTGDMTLTGSITATNIITDTGLVRSSSSTSQDNAITRFDGTTGKLIQNSALIATDFTSSIQNNVAIQPDDGVTASISLVLTPKGTGALIAQVPNGVPSGGNARGSRAIDWQLSRSSAAQVASGSSSTIGGGANNTASGSTSCVSGGTNNTASALISTVAGGSFNIASGTASIVAGGQSSTASGTNSTVCGGVLNTASGDYSYAAGRRAQSTAQGAFAWADSTNADYIVTVTDSFNVRASGGTTIYSDSGLTTGVTLAAGGSAWGAVSDRNVKKNINEVNYIEILNKLLKVPISTWSYQSQDESIIHMGPMAQDFYGSFGLGEDPLRITTQDAEGVALAAIQGLYKLLQEKNLQLSQHQEIIDELRARVQRLEDCLKIN